MADQVKSSSGRVVKPVVTPNVRSNRGRMREPSEFDDVIEAVYNEGWQEVEPADGESPARIKSEIRRANNGIRNESGNPRYGLDIHPTSGDELTENGTVAFRVRDKATRKKSANGDESLFEW